MTLYFFVYRALDTEANTLSKEVVHVVANNWVISKIKDGIELNESTLTMHEI
jgi:hypothetical protein